MRRYRMVLAAAMTAMRITACGSGDGIVINGTTAAESGKIEADNKGNDKQEASGELSSEDVVSEAT